MSLVWLDVGAHSAEEFGEACREVRALGIDDLCVNCLSDLYQYIVENQSCALIEVRICRHAFEDGPGS